MGMRNSIQYGHRFFVLLNQYGSRDVMQKTFTYDWIQHGHRSFVCLNQDGGLVVMRTIFHIKGSNMADVSLFQQINMPAVTSCTGLFNINKIQYGHHFFVWIKQYGDRVVWQKTT